MAAVRVFPEFVTPEILSTHRDWNRVKRDLIERKLPGAIVIGPPGGGKSHDFNQSDGKYRARCIYIAGRMTAFAGFEKIRDACLDASEAGNPHPLIVIDDVQDIVKDTGKIDLLKQFCCVRELNYGRRITYISRATGDRGDEFICNSPMLIMGNELPTDLTESQYAVFSRLEAFYFGPSAHEIHEFLGKVWERDKEVYRWVGQHLDLIQRPDCRFYDKLANRKDRDSDWRKWGLEMFIGLDRPTEYKSRADENERVKLRIIGQLLREKMSAKVRVELFEQRCKEARITGGSRADFFNAQQRYFKSGGKKC